MYEVFTTGTTCVRRASPARCASPWRRESWAAAMTLSHRQRGRSQATPAPDNTQTPSAQPSVRFEQKSRIRPPPLALQVLKVFIVSGLFLLILTRAFWAVSAPFFILSCPGSAPRSGRFFWQMGTDRVLKTHYDCASVNSCYCVMPAWLEHSLFDPRARAARASDFFPGLANIESSVVISL